MLQNLTNALLNSDIFEHRHLKIYSRLTHAFKILYFGIHLVDQPHPLQYLDQFRTLVRTFTQVVYQSIKVTPAQGHEIASVGSSTTSQDYVFAQLLHDSSTKLKVAVNTVTKACLDVIQKQDLKVANLKNGSSSESNESNEVQTAAYETEITLFDHAKTFFEDGFVEWLLTLYMTSQSVQDDEEINKEFYRIRQLGLVKTVREKYPWL